MEAIDVAQAEMQRLQAMEQDREKEKAQHGEEGGDGQGSLGRVLQQMAVGVNKAGTDKASGAVVNPFMHGLSPQAFVVSVLSAIPLPALDDCLLLLPFSYVLSLLSLLCDAIDKGEGDVEVCVSSLLLLLSVHEKQLISQRSSIGEMKRMRRDVKRRLRVLKDLYGRNKAALHLLDQNDNEQREGLFTFGRI